MLNKTLKSITAVLVCLTMVAGSIPAVAAEINDPALSQGESAPAQTEPVFTEPIVTEPAVTAPVFTEPAVTEPVVTEPVFTEPSETEALPPEDTLPDDGGSLPLDPPAADPTLPAEETGDPIADVSAPIPTFAVQWGMLPMYGGANGVYQWSIVLENGGYYIYTVTNMYERASFDIAYDEGGADILRYEIAVEPVILDSMWNPIPGAYVQSYVDDVTRYSEIYIPQSFFKDYVFTITCGQPVYSLNITDSYGIPAMPDIWSEAATLEEPVIGDSVDTSIMSDAEFFAYVDSMAVLDGTGCGANLKKWGYRVDQNNCYFYAIPTDGQPWYTQIVANGLYLDNNYTKRSANIEAGRPYTEFVVSLSQLGGSEMTVGGQTYSLAPGTSTMGAQPIGPSLPDEPEQPAEDFAFIEEVNGAIASASCADSNWGIIYKDGCYNLYITGNQWNCAARFGVVNGYNYMGVEANALSQSPAIINGVSVPITKLVESDSTYYALYSIPESALPSGLIIKSNRGDVSVDDIKANGSSAPTEPEDPTVAAIKEKVGGGSWAIELGNDGAYHLYIVGSDSPDVIVTDRATNEIFSPITTQVIAAEKDGLMYSEYTLSELPEWFDITCSGETKTFGTNPDQAFIDNVAANAGDGWNVVLNDDGSCNIYVLSDAEPTAGDFIFDNHNGEDAIVIDEASSNTVYDPATGKFCTRLTVANPSEWFNITYNGVTKTIGENPEQDTIDEIANKVGAAGWKVEKGEDGLYHIYVVDGVNDNAAVTAADKTDGTAINVDLATLRQVTDENGIRYSEYTASIDSKWFDISYNGSEPVTFGKNPNSAYSGIVIDGEFADWDAVPKYAIEDCNPNYNAVEEVAMIWDGDMIYIYLYSSDLEYGAVTGAGPNSNGQYAITTDLGYTLLIQPTRQLTINGIDEATVAINTTDWGVPHCWEIAIPSSYLPDYKKSISFGMYLGDKEGSTPIQGVTDLQGSDTSDKEFNGIIINGEYSDWDYYPHTVIQYATAGTGQNVVDANAALYNNGGKYIYGHAETVMPQHYTGDAWEVGKFNLSINDTVFDPNTDFQSRLVYEDPVTHQLTFDPQPIIQSQEYYQPYHYYIIDIGYNVDPSNIHSIEQLAATGKLYGDGYITRTPDSYDIEFEIDIEMLANKAGIEPNDIKTINAQFIRLGDQWVTTAGTSTGTFLGILLCLATVSGSYIFKKKKAMRIN